MVYTAVGELPCIFIAADVPDHQEVPKLDRLTAVCPAPPPIRSLSRALACSADRITCGKLASLCERSKVTSALPPTTLLIRMASFSLFSLRRNLASHIREQALLAQEQPSENEYPGLSLCTLIVATLHSARCPACPLPSPHTWGRMRERCRHDWAARPLPSLLVELSYRSILKECLSLPDTLRSLCLRQ